jgi:broad specificity phosphatase PhoE
MKTIVMLLLLCSHWAHANANFSIYLVRHAEQQLPSNTADPKLTHCGYARAEQLAQLLAKVELTAIYSTSYQRTMSTAAASAKLQGVAIKYYSAEGLPQLALRLAQSQQNALVVGHTNTTPLLAELLIGTEFPNIPEHEYQTLYQLQFIDNKASVTQLTLPLVCHG